ncbi:MAG: lipoprotein [Clostridia bacterium]|nr:lipoprotein [Clostridia bacterium]
MKKIVIIFLASLMLIVTGCSKEVHASEDAVIDNFFSAYTSQDYSTAQNYVAADSQDSFASLQTLVADDEINGIILSQMSDMSYKIVSSEFLDNTAKLTVRIVYPNAGGAFMNAIGSMYVDASEGTLNDRSSEDMNTYIRGLLLTHLNAELEKMDRERTVELVKEDSEWRIVMTEEFKNAISANMMNAIEELEIMGVQF